MENSPPQLKSNLWMVTLIVVTGALAFFTLVGFDTPLAAGSSAIAALLITCAVIVWTASRDRKRQRDYQEKLAAWTTQQAVDAERLRIAADLHDLVSHGLGSITMRAAAARLDSTPQELVVALADIEDTSREATTELRRMLLLLRNSHDTTPFAPADSLESLPLIVEEASATGLNITTHFDALPQVSAGAQVAICAFFREGLANVRRHAGPTRVVASLTAGERTIAVRVCDDGPQVGWLATPGTGQGLIGLHQRFTNLGGAIEAQVLASGFGLQGHIPLEEVDE